MTIPSVVYLYSLQARGMKLGLRNIRRLMAAAGHPDRAFPSIHIAGSNGKGSTAAYLASIFMEAGYRTGLYTSPHLVRFNERIRINGVEITDADLVRLVDRLRPAIEQTRATFFEATTCMAFLHFAEQGIDMAVIETGLGGRLDATNVLIPAASVITTISLEHTAILGNTVASIAREKGGIIKQGVPVVTGSADHNVLEVLDALAAKRGSRVVRTADEVSVRKIRGRRISLHTPVLRVGNTRPAFRGEHQVANAALAVATVSRLLRKSRFRRLFSRVNGSAVRRGLERADRNSGLRGRLEKAGRRVLLDVAHNPEGMRVLVDGLRARRNARWTVVFGVMKDKDLEPMALHLRRIARRILTVRPDIDRAVPALTLARRLQRLGANARAAGTVARGVDAAHRYRDRILITGSHYVVGEAMTALESRR